MKLNIAVAGKVLASVPVDPTKGNDDYYLKAFRRMLVIRSYKKLKTAQAEPRFFLE
jgi:hypothetical protein